MRLLINIIILINDLRSRNNATEAVMYNRLMKENVSEKYSSKARQTRDILAFPKGKSIFLENFFCSVTGSWKKLTRKIEELTSAHNYDV